MMALANSRASSRGLLTPSTRTRSASATLWISSKLFLRTIAPQAADEQKERTMQKITLHGKIIITGEIELLTGLHIGGAAAGLDIGGIDNPIIRHPITRQPYIPGSSLRGKMRSWLDRYYGKELNKFIRSEWPEVRVHECASREAYASCEVCQLFGITPGEKEKRDIDNLMPTRLIVRDVHLMPGEARTRGSLGWLDAAKTDLPYTEVKWEAAIDRITS